MRSVRVKAVLLLLRGLVALGLLTLAWAIGPGPSEAQQGAMHNCPQSGKWAISVWSGDDGIGAEQAFATCDVGAIAAAYYLDPENQTWQRWFAGRPLVSTLETLNDMQGVIALGAMGAPPPTATPTPTPTPAPSPTPAAPTPTPTPLAGATFSGPLQPGGGVSGTITLTLSATGDEIVEVTIRDDLDNVTCPWGSISGTGRTATHFVAIPIVEGAFTFDGQRLRLSGVFDSPTSASGTISEDLKPSMPCFYEPVTWTASVQGAAAALDAEGLAVAQASGQLRNCPQPGKWAISVWSGDDGTGAEQAFATCGDGVVDFAYYLDPATNKWLGYFDGRPDVSKLLALDNMQGVLAHGAPGAPTSTPTPTPTPTLTPTTWQS